MEDNSDLKKDSSSNLKKIIKFSSLLKDRTHIFFERKTVLLFATVFFIVIKRSNLSKKYEYMACSQNFFYKDLFYKTFTVVNNSVPWVS